MKVGLIGPAQDDLQALQRAALRLVEDEEVDQAIYLGEDTALQTLSRVEQPASEGHLPEHAFGTYFVRRAAKLWQRGSAEDIEELLVQDRRLRALTKVFSIPHAPCRGIELIGDRICFAVYDKALLDEDDIYNATLVVYGKADTSEFRRFGARCFFSPGPVPQGQVGIIDVDQNQGILLSLIAPNGDRVWTKTVSRHGARLTVQD